MKKKSIFFLIYVVIGLALIPVFDWLGISLGLGLPIEIGAVVVSGVFFALLLEPVQQAISPKKD